MYNGKAVLNDGRTLTKRGTFPELATWAEDLIALYGCLSITITEIRG